MSKEKEVVRETISAEIVRALDISKIKAIAFAEVGAQGNSEYVALISFEDAIRNAISIGGDSDTIGAICGAVAGAYYGVPADIREKAESFLGQYLLEALHGFERMFAEGE